MDLSIYLRRVYTLQFLPCTACSKLPGSARLSGIAVSYRVLDYNGRLLNKTASSRGRGARAAAWFSDYADDRGDSDIHSLILFEGINGWATAGGEFAKLMDEYDATFWVAK